MREIDIILKPLFNSCGFSLKRTSWYRLTDDFIQIIKDYNIVYKKSQLKLKRAYDALRKVL